MSSAAARRSPATGSWPRPSASHAVDLIAAGRFDRMVAWQNREVVDVPIMEAIAHYQAVDAGGTLVRTARGLGICLRRLRRTHD